MLTMRWRFGLVIPSRTELLGSLEKFEFDMEQALRWLNGVGTLMGRQAELGIVAREEVEKAMELHKLDDEKVTRASPPVI